MNFEMDAFISYAHLDNVELIEGRKGWVANLHRALEIRVAQLLGKTPQIWRDPKLQGNDLFAETLIERLAKVAVLVSIVSPRYMKSEWTRRELEEFWKSAEENQTLRVQGKARVFKVLKTPVPLNQQSSELQSLLGYEFFTADPETGKVRELDDVFGPEAQREFWIRLDDLAHDICALLETMEGADESGVATEAGKGIVFLAETTRDLKQQRETIQRDLQQHGYTVIPTYPLPMEISEFREAVQTDLANAVMSIHLLGKTYGMVPEGGSESLVELQNELAIERAEKGNFTRLLWIPRGVQIDDLRQSAVIEKIRLDPRMHHGTDLLETSIEDFRTVYQERLRKPPAAVADPPVVSAAVAKDGEPVRLFLIYDSRDAQSIQPWADFLFEQRLEVIHPVFDGDEADIREYVEENLRDCDGVLIFYGSANELWLRRKLRELQKSAAYGRTRPMSAVGIAVLPPKTAEKERFRTHEAIVISQLQGLEPDQFGAFVSQLKTPAPQ